MTTVTLERPILQLPRLRSDQYAIACHPAKIKVLAMGRRWGKTVLGGTLSLATAARGGRVAWVVPIYRNGRPIWRWAEAAVAPLRKAGIVAVNRAERTIDFLSSGGFLGIYSADNEDSIRGEAFHLVIIDEAAMVPETAWTDVIQPTLADYHGDAILISTPKGRNWFWREFQRGLADGREIASFTAPSSANPNPRIQQAAAKARTRVSDRTYRQEWLAEFVEDGTTSFSASWWDGQHRYPAADRGLRNAVIGRWLSWDTGLKDTDTSAYSACTVGELVADYRLIIRHVWRDRLNFPDLTAAIEQLARTYNYDGKLRGVIIEDKASGTSAYQTLIASSDPWLAELIVPFSPHGSKEQRAEQAGVWCRNGCVWLPHPGPEVPWLEVFEEELFAFPDTEFKDQVDSFSQLILYLEHYLSTGFHARGGADGIA